MMCRHAGSMTYTHVDVYRYTALLLHILTKLVVVAGYPMTVDTVWSCVKKFHVIIATRVSLNHTAPKSQKKKNPTNKERCLLYVFRFFTRFSVHLHNLEVRGSLGNVFPFMRM